MPPKKQEEENSAPYLVWNVLPVFCGAQTAVQALKKPVNIKKTLQLTKIIEVLKEKGIQKYLQEGVLNDEGYNLVCQNLQQVGNEYITQLRKPADPKKEQKKDSKKDSKKQEVPVQEAEKTIEFTFEKSINEFLVFLDFPKDQISLKTALQNGWKLDVVVWIEEMVKQSSRLPNYDLLNRERTIDDFLNEINSTSPKAQNENHYQASNAQRAKKLEIVNELKRLRVYKVGDLENTIIIQIPFLRDLQHPQSDMTQFLTSFFKKLCELSLNRTRFETWKKEQQISEMVPPIKEKIRREVVVEEKKEDKKGGKKEANPIPQTQIIEEIIEKRYEDIPGNAKSNLSIFTAISQNRKNVGSNIYEKTLDNLALSVSEQTERKTQVQKINIIQFGSTFLQNQKASPTNRITIQNIANRVPKILNSQQSAYLKHQSKLNSHHPLALDVGLTALLKSSPLNRSLEFEYKMHLFDKVMKQLETKLTYTFEDRIYAQRLSEQVLNSRINLQLELEPKVYLSQSSTDNFRILVLARVNPPGRVFYENSIFQWKVLPNFQFWQKYFKDGQHRDKKYWNYDWKTAGNLKVLTKKLMPTDNMIITESVFIAGDTHHKILSLQKDEVGYELKSIKGDHIFSKHSEGMHLDAFTQQSGEGTSKKVLLSVRKPSFTVLFEDSPTIFWQNHPFEEKRQFGAEGEVIKYLKNGFIIILYPNGNSSQYQFGEWKHIRNNKRIEAGKDIEMKMINRTDGDKKITVREDETTFVEFASGDLFVLFRDGTKYIHFKATNTIEVLNQCGIVVRKIFSRTKDFNIIGSGSAFAFLGEKNILERSFDGGLYELHHSTFTWHSYTQCVDREGQLAKQEVKMVTFRDGSLLKVNHAGFLTFLHGSDSYEESILHERWLQLFTNPQYHGEGVYDVDLINGTISTKDKQSNIFKLSLEGENDVRIAVSFNISNSKEDVNGFGSGYHVPEENYFLPPPQNYVTPRLFLIYSDGSGEQFLSQQQVDELKGFKKNKASVGSQSFVQLMKQNHQPKDYYGNSFTHAIKIQNFQLPSILGEQAKIINLIPSHFDEIIFRNLEEIVWDKEFKNLKNVTETVQEQRKKYKEELEKLRKRTL